MTIKADNLPIKHGIRWYFVIVLALFLFCANDAVCTVYSFDDYRNEVNYRMSGVKRVLESEFLFLVSDDQGTYDARDIIRKVNEFLKNIQMADETRWVDVLVRELPRFWDALPTLSEEMSVMAWRKGNFDRLVISNGLEILPRKVQRSLDLALMRVSERTSRPMLVELWKDVGSGISSNFERPIAWTGISDKIMDDRRASLRIDRLRHPENVLFFAHRGGHVKYPENSMGAFRHAYALGADGIECDLRLSKDGVVFVLHDDDLNRVAGVKKRVSEVLADYLDGLTLILPAESTETLREAPVRLERILEELGETLYLWLELKPDGGKGLSQAVGDLLEKHKLVKRVIVSSFSAEMVDSLRTRFPEILVAYEFSVLRETDVDIFLKAHDKARIIVSADHPEQMTPELVQKLVAGDVKVSSFVVNRYDSLKTAAKMGVRYIQTGRPDRGNIVRNQIFPMSAR